MTTGSCTNDLLAADGGVVDQCGSVDVVDRALAGLVVAGEAPGVDLAVGGDGEVVIGTGGDGDDVLGFCELLALVLKNWRHGNLPGWTVGLKRIRALPRSS